jgi:hydroxylamine dehydrogenase
MKKAMIPAVLALMVVMSALNGCFDSEKAPEATTSTAYVTDGTKDCLECHTKKQPAIVAQWRSGKMADAGVGCFECHGAKEGEPDAIEHFNGHYVSSIVSPNDCGRCHGVQKAQFLASHHAKAGAVLGSLDNYLGEVVEGFAANVSGCQQCHGSKVEILEGGRASVETWPNYGIGRINPDGTVGLCAACHSRHDFSLAQVRTPETCGKCHLGPDHPQMEIYTESKHNIAYRSHEDQMNMGVEPWLVGVDYVSAPVCATCHVSATLTQPSSHDIGLRLSWNIRAPISKKTESDHRKRLAMKDVCMTCHNPAYIEGFYSQFDAVVELYNDKFVTPAKEIMDKLREAGKLDDTPFNEKIEWTYFYLWHHEGRRARNGAAMCGPDYVQWHGFYEIAERFYLELIPEAEELLHGVTDEYMSMPDHKWFSGKMSDGDRKAMMGFYREKYGVNP